MATIVAGRTAPDFNLKDVNGGQHSLKDALQKGPVATRGQNSWGYGEKTARNKTPT